MTDEELIEKAARISTPVHRGFDLGQLDPRERDLYLKAMAALADAGLLADPERQRPVVLLRAEDCACPVGGDCPHGPEPVDALDLAVWLHAEARHNLREEQVATLALFSRVHQALGVSITDPWHGLAEAARKVVAERDALQARLDAVLALHSRDDDGDCRECGVDAYGEAIAWPCATVAALQGDQPTEPRHDLILTSGLSGSTGACSCGGWRGGGRHELPSRIAHRWDAEHLTSLPLEQPVDRPEAAAAPEKHVYEDDAAHNWAGICRICSYPPGGPQHVDAPAEPTTEVDRG